MQMTIPQTSLVDSIHQLDTLLQLCKLLAKNTWLISVMPCSLFGSSRSPDLEMQSSQKVCPHGRDNGFSFLLFPLPSLQLSNGSEFVIRLRDLP